MAQTTAIQLNDQGYTQLNTNTDAFVIQNVGSCVVYIIASDAQPEANARGHRFEIGEAADQTTFGGSTLWGRSTSPVGYVAVTE